MISDLIHGLALADETRSQVVVPGSALAQAIRNPARQARLARLLRQPRTEVVAPDRVAGRIFVFGWALVLWLVGGFLYLIFDMPRTPRDPWDNGSRI